MKFVMAAQSPLTLDELKVALTIVPGDPVWYAEKVPADSSQLIPLCGGNLLELDEEDEKVRFIHHSVVSHLLHTTKNPRTRLYHFTSPEAEIQLGSVCVTFLNMPIFETAVTITRKLDGARFAEQVIGAATHEQPILGHFARLFKKMDRYETQSIHVDIGRLLADLQANRVFKFDPHCFQEYAVSNWFSHSLAFRKENPTCKRIWQLWLRLLGSNIQVAKPPFQNPADRSWPALSWALQQRHTVLIFAIFEEPATAPSDGENISQGIVELQHPHRAKRYDSSALGLILVHLFQLALPSLLSDVEIEDEHDSTAQASILREPWNLFYQSLQRLMDLGAEPMVTHSQNGTNILRMLLATLSCISETTTDGQKLCEFLMQVLTRDNTKPLLPSRSAWVRDALRGILERDNSQIFATLLPYLTQLHLKSERSSYAEVAVMRGNVEATRLLINSWPAEGLSPGINCDVKGKPFIQIALEMENREMLKLLARDGGLTDPHYRIVFSAPLLDIALELMKVEWTELLLQLGADPNVGYQAIVEGSFLRKEFRYHLQVTAERNQSLKFLTLLRYGANPSLPLFPAVKDIIRRHDNRVLMARLKEIDFFERINLSKSLGVMSKDEPPPCALLEACKTLALAEDEDVALRHLGIVRSHDAGMQASEQELTLVLLNLAETNRLGWLDLQRPDGDTVLHHLTSGIPNFNPEVLHVASHLLFFKTEFYKLLFRQNEHGYNPLHGAIDNGSKNGWNSPYIDSALFLLSRHRGALAQEWLTLRGNNILGFALSRGAPIHPLIRTLLEAKVDTDATLQGATPLEIAVNLPEFLYASMATECLLSYGADPSVNCSDERSLLDVVSPERRDWLKGLLQRPTPVEPERWRGTTEVYELEDPRTTRLLLDAARGQRSQLKRWAILQGKRPWRSRGLSRHGATPL